jgi:hypothetical protein
MDPQGRPASAKHHPLLRPAPALTLLLLLSLAYNWYYLMGGFLGEDYIFVGMLREEPLPFSRWLGFWSSSDYPALTSLWWFEGQGITPFWRPLPSLLIEGSILLFGERAFPLHLLSVVVHSLVGGTLFLLVRRLTGRPLVAFLAGLLFLSCEDHTMGVGWISTVTDLLCVLFVNLALLAHASWLEKRNTSALLASLAALVLALFSKESAVVAPLAIVLMSLLMPRGREAQSPGDGLSARRAARTGLLRDWRSWMPAILLLLAYLALYKLVGFGGFTTGLYVDPLSNPTGYLTHLVVHLPVMWLATLSPVPPSIAMFWPAAIALLALAGTVLFVIWMAGLWPLRRRALVVWALGVYLIALLPQMATDAGERGLYFPMIGASILLALLMVQIGPIARRDAPNVPPAPGMTRMVGWGVLVCVLAPGVVLSAAMPFIYAPTFEKPTRQAASILPSLERWDPDDLLVLNTPGPLHTFYLHPTIAFHAEATTRIYVLSSMNGVMSVERLDDRSFILRADRKGWLTNLFAGVLRSRARLSTQRVYEKDVLAACPVELTSDRRDVLAVRFELNRPLSDPDLLIMYWDGERFLPIELAELPVQSAVTLADTSDVWESMW